MCVVGRDNKGKKERSKALFSQLSYKANNHVFMCVEEMQACVHVCVRDFVCVIKEIRDGDGAVLTLQIYTAPTLWV